MERKKKMKDDKEFEFCKICKLNHDQGQRHKYFPNHTKSLSSFLSRFQNKLSDVRFFLKNPTHLRPEHASRNRIWCVFCDSDIEEVQSLFACNNAINHLASSEHLKNLKNFLWKYGGGMDRVDSFIISQTDLSKWEKRCKLLTISDERFCGTSSGPSNDDIHNQLNSETMDNLENNSTFFFNSSISNGCVPLQCNTNESVKTLHREVNGVGTYNNSYVQGRHTMEDTIKDLTDYRNLQNNFIAKSSIGYSPSNNTVYQAGRVSSGESNKLDVSAGMLPPWLEKDEENQFHQLSTGTDESNLAAASHKKGKSQKLNPKRVGAAWAEKRKREMEMEKRGEIVTKSYDANWLPDFGRVWQSGTRKESRKEFEIEKQKLPNVNIPSDLPVGIQPYISKRMRKTSTETETVESHLE